MFKTSAGYVTISHSKYISVHIILPTMHQESHNCSQIFTKVDTFKEELQSIIAGVIEIRDKRPELLCIATNIFLVVSMI